MVSMYQFMIGLGLTIGVCVDYATSERTDTGAFRIPMAVQYLFPIVLTVALVTFCPESPRWLAANNKIEQCEKALQRLRGPHVDVHDDLERINQSLHEESVAQQGSSWSSIFRDPVERRKAYLGWSLQGK
jgi:hypothetical protein